MRRIVPLILVLAGLGALGAYVSLRLDRERAQLRQERERRQASMTEGWREAWARRLVEHANGEGWREAWTLRWNRTGRELRTAFFPSEPVALPWDEYRAAKTAGDAAATKAFLARALDRAGSWDRVLALGELGGEAAAAAAPSGYERTLVDPEAKAAYTKLFALFESRRGLTSAPGGAWRHDGVLHHVTADGDVEAAVPKLSEVRAHIVPAFVREHDLASVELGNDPWDVAFVPAPLPLGRGSLAEMALLAVFVACSLGGLGIYAAALRRDRAGLLRKVGFLDQVVHELKTPLTGLKLHAQLVARLGPDAESLEALSRSVDKMDALFEDIILLRSPGAAGELQELAPEELGRLLATLAAEFGGAARLGDAPAPLSTSVRTEPKRLTIILRNLLRNAVRYGHEAVVTVSASAAGTRIEVRDRGPGVARADARRIFREFYRSDAARRVSADGLGLGLAIASRLAREMSARIELLNPGEPGARFALVLPSPPK